MLFILHGRIPKGVSIVDGKPLYYYKGIKIEAPRDSIEAYVEVFQDNVYDKKVIPQMGDIVIDIGAYVGMYSIKASHFVGPEGLVIAVEPLLGNLAYLKSNVKYLSNIKVIKVALSNYIGHGKLYSSPSTAAHSMTYVRKNFTNVKVTTLDELVRKLGLITVDYIKIDAEGSDMKILEGAKGVLKKYSPIISIACYHISPDGHPYISKVLHYLKRLGYKCIAEKGYIYTHKTVPESTHRMLL